MPVGISGGNGPSYISSHSADVILSDIRPIKLKIEGLRCINVLLDEFLYNILSTARSLTTDKLRAGLLSVLPTALGKEALLEAEVELRAYWDRTKPPKSGLEDDTSTFNLQWAFELLRLKCEAYSTLNESDGDKSAESRLHERLAGTGQPPKASLVAPAALYLTAILEAMCEHVLSNVGRVASRDSSRTFANVQDVFVALCEDESIYNLFKTMDVYEQIEQLSQAPKPRRSKSISRNDKMSLSRTSSSHHDQQSSGQDSPTPPSGHRRSSEGPAANRSSFDRAKSVKKLINGRGSHDGSANGHKRSESVLSDETKQALAAYGSFDPEEQANLQEFDDLMKSDSTMKVSLTPDRLKTMEVYKQERDQRGNRTKAALLTVGTADLNPPSSSLPPRSAARRPSAPNVASIVEDEEEPHSRPSPRPRQASVVSPPPKPLAPRTRSHSAAAPVQRKSSKSALSSSTSSTTSPPPSTMMHTREFRTTKGFDGDPFLQKTRKVQRARESLDLDDIMNGSDEEEDLDTSGLVSPSKSFASTPSHTSKVSARTRELMDFLNEGPPGSNGVSAVSPVTSPGRAGVSKSGRELMDFLAEGPPDFGPPPSMMMDTGSTKSKGSGRLQRMMSKLSLGNAEKNSRSTQQAQDDFRRPPTTPTSMRPPLSMKSSTGSLSALGNRPIPPRPPQPQMISPPSSPSQDTMELPYTAPSPPVIASPPPSSRSRQASLGQASVTRKQPNWEQDAPVSTMPVTTPLPPPPIAAEKSVSRQTSNRSLHSRPSTMEKDKAKVQVEDAVMALSPKSASTSHNGSAITAEKAPIKSNGEVKKSPARVTPPALQTSRKPSPEVLSPSTTANTPAGINAVDAQDMKRLLLKATSPEECRLIMDMFLAKAGIPVEPTEYDVPYPSPSSSDAADKGPSLSDIALEISLVELFLGGEPSHEPAPRKKRYTTKKIKLDTQAANSQKPSATSANGNAIPAPIAAPEDVSVKA